MARMITLQNVAEEAGVSIVTASRALTGRKGVSEGTRARIQKTAEQLGYQGAAPRTETKGYTIGVIVAERYLLDRQSMYWAVYQDLSKRMVTKGHFSALEIVPRDNEQKKVFPAVLENPSVDGLILLGNLERNYMDAIREKAKVPLVFVDTLDENGEYDSVVSNNFQGAYQVVNHLLDLGHTEIGYVGSLLVTDSIDDRFLGGEKALLRRGLRFLPEWVLEDRDRGTLEVSSSMIRIPDRNLPTAFFCNSDLTAGLLIEKLTGMGYHVPEDISVAGFDNFSVDPQWQDFITTYDINRSEMARKAVHVISHRIANPDYRDGMTVVQGSFCGKKSTARIGAPVPLVGTPRL